jgi:hypothetical protein
MCRHCTYENLNEPYAFNPLHAIEVVSEADKAVLRQLLERKLRGIPKQLLPECTVEDMLARWKGDKFPWPQYGPRGGWIVVPHSATFAGTLHYRGEVQELIRKGTPIHDWGKDVVLSYFVSNIDANYSFDTYFKETRVRLYDAASAVVEDKATKVQRQYLLACLEAKGYDFDSLQPVAHRLRFIETFRKKAKSTQDFMVYSMGRRNKLAERMGRDLDRLAKAWDQALVDQKYDSKYIAGLHVVNFLFNIRAQVATKGTGTGDGGSIQPDRPKKTPRGRKKKALHTEQDGTQDASASASGPGQSEPLKEAVLCLDLRPMEFENAIDSTNKLMSGLLAPFPGWHPYGIKGLKMTPVDEEVLVGQLTAAVDDLSMEQEPEKEDDPLMLSLERDFRALRVDALVHTGDVLDLGDSDYSDDEADMDALDL